ncbi:hypothetical protein FA13DRAFT_1801182 [Coprinellus micaceus]|uniref:Nephrocystin 3-like N-terminal domain-containing protein n=1 Tax=Coprinellus micaceus TaxID=71717 RepID=A0A4Y7SEJ8_COPMI|nr:hypothetical protein FA13DRAFT_1801182 [Coprinellus micaceus]
MLADHGPLSSVVASLFLHPHIWLSFTRLQALPSSVALNMPSPFRRLGRKIKSFFRRRSRDGRRNADHPEAIDRVATPSSAPPSTAAGLFPLVVVVPPTQSMGDLTENNNPMEQQDAGRHGPSPSVAHPSLHSGSHQGPSERPSFGAATSGIPSQSSYAPAPDVLPSESCPELVPNPIATPNAAQLPPTPHTDMLSPSPVPTPLAPSNSFFSKARDFTVSNLNVHNSFAPSKTLFEYLNPHIAHGAAHDSDERWNAPSCHEETRVAIREDIVSWIKHGEGDIEPKRMMWLSGPAGCGKSAIAGSVAETCKEGGLLAATFFFSSFSGPAERSSKRGFIPTLAYHMSQNKALSHFRSHLHEAVDLQPEIFRKNLKEQAKSLILEPFRKVLDHQESRVGWPKVIIIDGLDEIVAAQHHDPTEQQSPAASEDDQVEILHILLTLSKDPSFPFRIFIASRPERNISGFLSTNASGTTVNLFLDAKYKPDADIRRFLESKFAHIRRDAGISSPSWPGQPALDRLVEMSSGQFIVPTTVIRWVEAGIPQLQLDEVLQLAQPNPATKNPFATLDALYRHILQRAHNPNDDPHLVVKWIECITSATSPYRSGSPPANFWRRFLENVEGELNYRLGPITSLISVPPPSDTSSLMTIYHKSLTDFLSSSRRCGDLYVERAAHTSFISERIFVVLKNKGPIVPLPSLPDLARFLHSFFCLDLLIGESAEVLTSLSSHSKAELTSCDVAWWTRASLSNLLSDGSSLSQDGCHTEPLEDWGCHSWLVRLIYHRIHRAMEAKVQHDRHRAQSVMQHACIGGQVFWPRLRSLGGVCMSWKRWDLMD